MTALESVTTARRLPLTIDDFLLLDSSGAFATYGRTELIEGEVLLMAAQHRPHARLKMNLAFALKDALAAIASPLSVLAEVTVSIPPHNAPEPDVVLTNAAEGEGPVPVSSVALIVEIADSTLAENLGSKMRIYARGGVPEYWVADLQGGIMHLFSRPVGEGYADTNVTDLKGSIVAHTIEGLAIQLDRTR